MFSLLRVELSRFRITLLSKAALLVVVQCIFKVSLGPTTYVVVAETATESTWLPSAVLRAERPRTWSSRC